MVGGGWTEQNRAASMRLGGAGGQDAILIAVAWPLAARTEVWRPWSSAQLNALTRQQNSLGTVAEAASAN